MTLGEVVVDAFLILRLVNGVLGITWRLGFGVENNQEPEGTHAACIYVSSLPSIAM